MSVSNFGFLHFTVIIMLFSKSEDGETRWGVVVVKVDTNCRTVATQTPTKLLELGQQKKEGEYCSFVYFVFLFFVYRAEVK